jgi:hypothetical protein
MVQRIHEQRDVPALVSARRMYGRALTLWASDLLRPRGGATWPADDPAADYRDRDWSRLYQGSILDD